MALDFPASPSVNDTYTSGGRTWVWDGTTWKISGSGAETDPVYTASDAANVTSAKITNWDNAHGWGNHASSGYLTNLGSAIVDADFSAAGLCRTDGGGTYSVINDNHANWDTAYGWGDHAQAGYSTGATVSTRTTANATTLNIADGSVANITIQAAKSYLLHKIQTSHAAWVTVYTDATNRTGDGSRNETTDPQPGSGVIAEVITSSAATQLITPGTVGFNNDSTASTNVYLKVVNKSGGAASITVTLHYVKLED